MLLASLGNSSSYRIAYLLETLEITSPSRSHELDKKAIAKLLEICLQEKRIRFWGLGSTTFGSKEKQAGKEPDKCYCIGTDKDVPNLAIEVVYTLRVQQFAARARCECKALVALRAARGTRPSYDNCSWGKPP